MFSSFQCKACRQQVVLGRNGYYSCDFECDFDLCKNCVTCQIDGNMLFETFEMPSQETIMWIQMADTESNFEMTSAYNGSVYDKSQIPDEHNY